MAKSKSGSNNKTEQKFSIKQIADSDTYLENLYTVIDSHPDDNAKSFGLSVIFLLAQNYDLALRSLEFLIEKNPKEALPHRRSAEIFMFRREYSKAIDSLEQAIKLCPEDAISSIWLSLSYYKTGEIEKGEANLEEFEKCIFQLNSLDCRWT